MVVWSWDSVCPVLSVLDLVNDYSSIDSSFVSWVLVRDVSEDGEVTFRGINSVSLESFAFPAERISELFSEDYTLIFSSFDIVVCS